MGNPLTGGGVTPFVKDPEGLIAYYRMEDTFGAAGNVVDATGLAYTLVSDARTSSVVGQVGNAGTFAPDGVNQARAESTGNTSSSTFKSRVNYQGLSTSAWVRVNATPAAFRGYTLFTATGVSPNDVLDFLVGPTATNLIFYLNLSRNGSNIRNVSYDLTTYTVGVWRHLVATYNPFIASNNYKLYVDGAEVFSTSAPQIYGSRRATNQSTTYRIGSNSINSDTSLSMDEIGVWNRTLDASQVSFLYNGGAGRAYSEITF